MGCDIHVTVQKRVNGAWVDGQDWTNESGWPRPAGGELFGDRNYALFAILANVRGEVENPLAAGRGLPSEISQQMAEFHEGNHSATHFTVAEVMAYDWQQELPRSGWVDPAEFGRWKTRGHPENWRGSVGGGGVRHIGAEEMERVIRASAPEKSVTYPFHHIIWASRDEDTRGWLGRIEALVGGSPYCHVFWNRPFWTQGGDLFAEGLPRAWALGTPEDVRFVISFDN